MLQAANAHSPDDELFEDAKGASQSRQIQLPSRSVLGSPKWEGTPA
jgi:hypothetical protein